MLLKVNLNIVRNTYNMWIGLAIIKFKKKTKCIVIFYLSYCSETFHPLMFFSTNDLISFKFHSDLKISSYLWGHNRRSWFQTIACHLLIRVYTITSSYLMNSGQEKSDLRHSKKTRCLLLESRFEFLVLVHLFFCYCARTPYLTNWPSGTTA